MDEIELAPYDPHWPVLAIEEIARIRALLPEGLAPRIEHIGSTAVHGLAAKPIIDLLILTASIEDALARAVPPLEASGYSFWRDNPDKSRLFLVKGLPPSAPRRTHHVHITASQQDLERHCRFRDHLRAHPADAQRYETLKRELSARYRHDREAYTLAKGAFVAEIEARIGSTMASAR